MSRLEGPFAAAVTPSRSDSFQMDMGAALDVIDFLCSHHVRGIVLFGATGEFPHFHLEDRNRLANMAIKRSRAPVLVNATAAGLEDAVTLAEHAAGCGAAAVLIQPPYYFRYAPQDIREFLLDFIDEVEPKLPVILYNLPAFNNAIPPPVACELLSSGAAAGIKDSSGDWEYFSALLALRQQKEFSLLVGNDILLTRGRTAGADGFISGCAGAVPELLTGLDDAICKRDLPRIQHLTALLDEYLEWVDCFPGPLGIKETLEARGIRMGMRAIPYSKQTEAKAKAMREWLPAFLKRLS